MEYKCTRCGATGYSKCVNTRSFFPNNEREAVLSHLLKRTVKIEGNRAEVTLVAIFVGENLEPEKCIEDALKRIKHIDEKTLKEWVCDHNYEPNEDGVCLSGCCQRDLPQG